MQVVCPSGVNILEYLRKRQFPVTADCGGHGICGKCKIRLLAGTLPVCKEDEKIFSKEELAEGIRLACKAVPKEPVRIETGLAEDDFFAAAAKIQENARENPGHAFGIAIDVGTTTIAAALVDLESGKILNVVTGINPQRSYGADVMSRIQEAGAGKSKILADILEEELNRLTLKLLEITERKPGDVRQFVFAGNTTMLHFLMGLSPQGLAAYPFQPETLGGITMRGEEFFGFSSLFRHTGVQILPGIGAYVGADIVSGMYTIGREAFGKKCIFLDLGTNGEMALIQNDRLICTSVAAGPALEGGNLSCGTGSVKGAICHVRENGGNILYETIGGETAVGFCGTGIIDLLSVMLKTGIIDRRGMLQRKYEGLFRAVISNNHSIAVSQADIREFQLAKAAIRAGLEILLHRAGLTEDEIDTLYLAGGFGTYLDPRTAADTGILSRKLAAAAIPLGNASLSGAVMALTEGKSMEDMRNIAKRGEIIELANEPEFQELFIKYMDF